ncbi:hypothetical protein [Ornithinimicrobium cryptoxanthini]|nr:hypothetical protein [Ornithinimicrobium cryptoxanthini]
MISTYAADVESFVGNGAASAGVTWVMNAAHRPTRSTPSCAAGQDTP